ncbi:hypothetical protein [Nostoc sp. UHCC 0251]|uniref:hypothetical protein n=1 Tax=Nostoc sp. UHCC 0251 TaxID=3110240 RepID=UPI002B1EFD0D|nr:hypothetical protein [Nostoc sp. UHCC 0251]MEA5621467.1 hypothetical protein [Nostoc sp. UHCC 0251]
MTKRCGSSLPLLPLQRHDGNKQPMPQNSTSLKKALQAKFQRHITKPVDVDALTGIIVQLAQPH